MNKIKKIFKNPRVIILLLLLILAVWTIHPVPWNSGLTIRNVVQNSSADLAGISINPKLMPTAKERVLSLVINNKEYIMNTLSDYYKAISFLSVNDTFKVRTNKDTYLLKVKPKLQYLTTKELIEVEEPVKINVTEKIGGKNISYLKVLTRNITKQKEKIEYIFNESDNQTYKIITYENITEEVPLTHKVKKNKTIVNILGIEDPGLILYEAPKSNLKLGLDLQGGSRVLLEPEKELTEDQFDILKSNMERRLNVYGVSDISLRIVKDKPGFLGGKSKYILVEIPGANEQEVKDLLSKQGKFEAKIDGKTVFVGGKDITYVCRSAECSGIDPRQGCGRTGDGWSCRFFFTISLSGDAASKHAAITKNMKVEGLGANAYLEKPLELYLDDKKVDELRIGAELKGRVITDIQISGSGSGNSQQLAMYDALNNMKKLQSVLITGSLPVKLNIVRSDNISPILGKKFIHNSILVGFLTLLSVAIVIFFRYKKLTISIPMVLTMFSEIILMLGFAAFIKWNLDLAAIAGLIVAAGTGVDDLVVITDETLKKKKEVFLKNWKQKLKQAFFIIMGAYFTTLVAMLPLFFAGAGLLRGFAFTTIVGITIGVFIARPTYAKILEILEKN